MRELPAYAGFLGPCTHVPGSGHKKGRPKETAQVPCPKHRQTPNIHSAAPLPCHFRDGMERGPASGLLGLFARFGTRGS